MKRGDVVLVSLPGDFGKPRPALVIQSDRFLSTHATVLVSPMTSDLSDWRLFRVRVAPTPSNGLRQESEIMVDKMQAIVRSKVRGPIGQLDAATVAKVNEGIAYFTGLAD